MERFECVWNRGVSVCLEMASNFVELGFEEYEWICLSLLWFTDMKYGIRTGWSGLNENAFYRFTND